MRGRSSSTRSRTTSPSASARPEREAVIARDGHRPGRRPWVPYLFGPRLWDDMLRLVQALSGRRSHGRTPGGAGGGRRRGLARGSVRDLHRRDRALVAPGHALLERPASAGCRSGSSRGVGGRFLEVVGPRKRHRLRGRPRHRRGSRACASRSPGRSSAGRRTSRPTSRSPSSRPRKARSCGSSRPASSESPTPTGTCAGYDAGWKEVLGWFAERVNAR